MRQILVVAACLISEFFTTNLIAEERQDVLFTSAFEPPGLLVAQGKHNGHDVQCVLDTGSTTHVFDQGLQSLTGELKPFRQSDAFQLCENQELSIQGCFDTLPSESLVTDFAHFRKAGLDVDVVVGMPFLAYRTLEIDFENRQFAILRRPRSPGEVIELSLGECNRPYLRLEISGNQIESLLDTGNVTELLLEHKIFDQLSEAGVLRFTEDEEPTRIIDISGTSERRSAVLPVLKLAGQTIPDVRVLEGDENIVGLKLLSRFLVSIDLTEFTLTLSCPERAMP